jgi:ribosomal protein L11 methyltransferase
VRSYPALRISFFEPPTDDQLDQLAAGLDDYHPTAIDEIPNGVVAYFAGAAARDEALSHFGAFELLDVVAEDVPDENWAERSQASLTPVTVGRLMIAPPWTATDELRATAPGPVVIIQPSMGFGTGHHATTRLCLRLLQEIDLTGKSVLDIGTGSGVLAICARVLAASRVVGIDVDPDALENARENAVLNGVADSIEFQEADLSAGPLPGAPFGVVLANLTGGLLIRDAANIVALAALGGSLILSGYQLHERAAVTAPFLSLGCRLEAASEEETWCAMRVRR